MAHPSNAIHDSDSGAHEAMLAALADPENANVPALVAQLMAANHRDYVGVTNSLVESLQRQLADREAELGAIRSRINELFAGPYMPTETAIQMAVFYPSKELVEHLRKSKAGES